MKARPITLGILATGIMLAATTCTWGDNTVPKVNIPEVIMPTPNAYDFYIKAMTQRKNNGEVEDELYYNPPKIPVVPAPPIPVPAAPAVPAAPVAKPAVLSQSAAAPALARPIMKRSSEDDQPVINRYPLEKKLTLLANNAEALATFREGLKHTYLCPPKEPTVTYDSKLEKFRSFARLLSFESKVKLEQEKYGEALNVNLDTIQFGADLPRGGNLYNCQMGSSIEAMGRSASWSYLDKLSEAEAKGAAQRLEKIIDTEVPFSQTLTNEKWYMEGELIRMMKNGTLELALGRGTYYDWRSILSMKAQLASISNQKIIDNYDSYLNKCIIAAQFPYGDSQSLANADITLPNDPINRQILPSLYMSQFRRITSVEVQNRLLMTALALQAYKAKYKGYPSQLAALTPDYLTKLPNDPFGDNSTLKYRKDGDGYKLYSVGPDGKDDGGKEIFIKSNDTRNESAQYRVFPDSKGDIVAGINKG